MAGPGNHVLGFAFEAADCGLIVLGSAHEIVSWNAWMASTTSISAAAAVGRRLDEVFPRAKLHRLDAAVRQALLAGASGLLTQALHPALLPLKTRSGRTLIHDVTVRPIGAKPYEFCLVQLTDVTNATERERVLRARQNARYSSVVDNAPDAILTIDGDGVIQLANAAAARELGRAGEMLIGQPAIALFEEPDIWTAAWRGIVDGQTLHQPLEVVIRRGDGTKSRVEVSAARWLSESRVFVSTILRDVNQRHADAAALQRLNETLEERVATALAERRILADIVETTDAYIQVIDPDFVLRAVNRASADDFQRAYGRRPDVGDNVLDVLEGFAGTRRVVESLWRRALAGEAFTVVEQFAAADGEVRSYEMKFDALHDADGQQIAAFQISYDVTARIEQQAQLALTEEALRQSQKLEAIGQLTGGIAHDFNNMLTGIIGAMEIMKRRLASRRYDDLGRFMDAAVTSANRAAALTHRLLAFARRQPLAPKPTDVEQLVKGMDDFLRRTLGERVGLSIEVEPGMWPILSDASQLENAILNLAINSRDAMPDGGRLTITARNAHVAERSQFGQEVVEAGDYAVVSVHDSGMGMDADTVAKVFEPFFTTKPIGQGTGLGLSMIYGFAKQTRGSVRIESAVGEGTRVSLYLPRYRGALTTEEPAMGETPAGQGEAVLLVEDDSSVRLLIGEVLRELGYNCIEAIDAQAAMPLLTSNARINLMITDVGLPGMNGRQLAEIARQYRPHLKVLFVTGYAEHATGSEKFLDAGMEMVTKPFALDALALKIRNIIKSRGVA